jgi:hypothetical protein
MEDRDAIEEIVQTEKKKYKDSLATALEKHARTKLRSER